MNKLKLMAMVMGGLILLVGIGLIFFIYKSQDLSKKLEAMKPGYQKLSQEESGLKSKSAELLKENEAMKIDRGNLLAQIKTLLVERNRANELAASLEKANLDLAALGQEKKQAQDYSLGLKDEIQKLQEAQGNLIEERDKIKSAYEKARKDTEIKELNNRVSSLQRDKNNSEANLKRKEKEFNQLAQQKSKVDSDNEWLNSQLKSYKSNYLDGLKKNKELEQQVKNMPAKFTEIARQNKRLIKETSQMHYNLGVFYTKNKEYDRAIVEFEKVIEVDPNDSYAYFNLGYIYAEYLVNREKAVTNFRHFLRLAKSEDKDIDWVKKYLITWESYEGKKPM
jgi:tetratricopeptide (TPR) repeat protein